MLASQLQRLQAAKAEMQDTYSRSVQTAVQYRLDPENMLWQHQANNVGVSVPTFALCNQGPQQAALVQEQLLSCDLPPIDSQQFNTDRDPHRNARLSCVHDSFCVDLYAEVERVPVHVQVHDSNTCAYATANSYATVQYAQHSHAHKYDYAPRHALAADTSPSSQADSGDELLYARPAFHVANRIGQHYSCNIYDVQGEGVESQILEEQDVLDIIDGMVSSEVNEPTMPFSNSSLQQGVDHAVLQGQPAHTGPHDNHHVFKDADGGVAGTGRGAPGKVSTLINPRRKVHCDSNGICAATKTT